MKIRIAIASAAIIAAGALCLSQGAQAKGHFGGMRAHHGFHVKKFHGFGGKHLHRGWSHDMHRQHGGWKGRQARSAHYHKQFHGGKNHHVKRRTPKNHDFKMDRKHFRKDGMVRNANEGGGGSGSVDLSSILQMAVQFAQSNPGVAATIYDDDENVALRVDPNRCDCSNAKKLYACLKKIECEDEGNEWKGMSVPRDERCVPKKKI